MVAVGYHSAAAENDSLWLLGIVAVLIALGCCLGKMAVLVAALNAFAALVVVVVVACTGSLAAPSFDMVAGVPIAAAGVVATELQAGELSAAAELAAVEFAGVAAIVVVAAAAGIAALTAIADDRAESLVLVAVVAVDIVFVRAA